MTQVALSGHHTLALRHSGELYTWGANENGVLGLSKEGRASARLPTLVPGASFEQVRRLRFTTNRGLVLTARKAASDW